MSDSALRLDTGGRSAIKPGLKRTSNVLGSPPASDTVLLTATGGAGNSGDPAVRLVVEELSLEIDSATNLSMEGRIVKEKKRRAGSVILGAVRWTVAGMTGHSGDPAVKHVEVGIQSSQLYFLILIFALYRRKKN